MTKPTQKEMLKLAEMLTAAEIPHVTFPRRDGLQLLYPGRGDWICSVICFDGSYGYEEGLLEIMGLTHCGQSVEGYLTAENVFERIAADYKQRQPEARQ
jgi:hypothetical protein